MLRVARTLFEWIFVPSWVFPAYAETHFHFRLPRFLAPLHHRQPEILVDLPHLAQKGVEVPLFLVVKDAKLYPLTLDAMDVVIHGPDGFRLTFMIPVEKEFSAVFDFLEYPLPLPKVPGLYRVNVLIRGRSGKGKKLEVLNWNYPGLPPEPLEIRRLAEELPWKFASSSWQSGETHCHSWHSSDPVEFGASPGTLQSAARCLGLDWVLCTDHSYDFCYDHEDYMTEVDACRRWEDYRKEIDSLDSTGPLLIAGEELSCANRRGENVHLLIVGNKSYLPGLGDGGRRWLNNVPDLSIDEALERCKGLPCFAAHPRAQIGALERLLFRRGQWEEKDLAPGLRGLQFWNGHRGKDFLLGRAFWVQQLLKGNPLLPLGGNDAHGDLNRSTGVKVPLFSLWFSRRHVFGKVRTVICSTGKSLKHVQSALSTGKLFLSDGPFVQLQAEDLNRFRLEARSSLDFGKIRRLVFFEGRRGEDREKVQALDLDTFHASEIFSTSENFLYVRAEVYTKDEHFAMTPAKFANVKNSDLLHNKYK